MGQPVHREARLASLAAYQGEVPWLLHQFERVAELDAMPTGCTAKEQVVDKHRISANLAMPSTPELVSRFTNLSCRFKSCRAHLFDVSKYGRIVWVTQLHGAFPQKHRLSRRDSNNGKAPGAWLDRLTPLWS